jgi:dienelactone hydrolase
MRAERRALAWLAWLPLLVLCGGATGATLVPERVAFDSLDRDPATGAPVRIDALLFRPEGPSDVRRAAVVALHGCGGMYSTSRSRRDELSLRHQAMAELLVGEGYVVLFPDSFRARGRNEICTVENRRRTIRETNRRLDAQGALAFLQTRADVAPDRVAVLGWSHGGSAVLAVLDARQSAVAGWPARVPPSPYFRAGVALYPGCVGSLGGRDEYAVAAPLRLFIAGSDDWTAPGPCIDLAHRLSAAGEPVKITVYPEAFHGFDVPTGQQQRRLDVPNGVHPGKGVTVAPNPAARADAYLRLLAFLHAHLREAGRGADRPRASAAGSP